jgi:hypothetical protein
MVDQRRQLDEVGSLHFKTDFEQFFHAKHHNLMIAFTSQATSTDGHRFVYLYLYNDMLAVAI